jgi:hypothetical protein
MSEVQRLQKTVLLPDWLWVLLFIIVIVCSIFIGSIWFFVGLFVVLVAQGVYLFGIARCPVCSGKFGFHRGRQGASTRYRLELECKRCRTIWDTGRIRDDNTFSHS